MMKIPANEPNRSPDSLAAPTVRTVKPWTVSAETAALQESEARCSFLAEAMPQIIWISTMQNEISYVNRHCLDYIGLTLEQIRAGAWERLIHPDDLRSVLRQIATGRKNGRYEVEYRLRRASDSTWRWHLARVRLGRTEDGSGQWLGTAIDVHDRREIEESLARKRELERRLLLLLEASSELIASPESDQVLQTILDIARGFLGADAYGVWRGDAGTLQWRMLAGAGLSDSYKSTMTQEASGISVVPEAPFTAENIEDSPLLRHRLEELRAEGIRSILVVPLVIQGQVDGAVVFYYRTPHQFREVERRVAGGLANLAAAALSTAELYQRQTALRVTAEAAERRAKFLAEAGSLLSSSLDYEATLRSVADLAVPAIADSVSVDLLDESGEPRRVAVKHRNVQQRELSLQYAQRYPSDRSRAIGKAMEAGKAILFDLSPSILAEHIECAEKREAIQRFGLANIIIAPLRTGGRNLGAISFASAESDQRFTAANLVLAEELARRAAMAIANAHLYKESQRSQAALERSNLELKRANEDLNHFAYSASHDLQEPLRMITIYSQMLEMEHREKLDDHARQYIRFMTQGARQMEMLIRDVLQYTRVTNIPEEGTVSVEAGLALEKALLNLDASIRDTNAGIHFGPLPRLNIQEVHLVQVLQNLIGNAIKYRGADAPHIEVSAEPAGDLWKISVKDNGIGIAPQYFERIFGMFKRLHSPSQYPGTGVGLAICQKIIERYGGSIRVDSEEGKGATFSFTLPGESA